MDFRRLAVTVIAGMLEMISPVSAQTGTTTVVTAAPNPALLGAPVTLKAIVSDPTATGQFTFYDGATVLGRATVSGGTAQLNSVLLPTGAQQLRARYDGDSTFASSFSGAFAETVLAATSPSFAAPVGYAAQTNPEYLAVGDLNKDGKADLVVTNETSGTFGVYLGNGDGTFESAVTYTGLLSPIGAVVADFDGDGNPDVAVAVSSGVQVFLGDGTGALQTPATSLSVPGTPEWLTAADTNGDGIVDLLIGTASSGIHLLVGDGAGGFTAQPFPGVGPLAGPPIAADFRNIGRADIAVPVMFGPPAYVNLQVLLNNGDGTFQAPEALSADSANPDALAAADLNGDGNLDLAVANYGGYCYESGSASVFFGNGDGTFQFADNLPDTGFCAVDSIVVGDFNGDGTPDIAVGDSLGDVYIYYGTGQGNFGAPIALQVGSMPSGMVGASFTQTGTLDLAVADSGASSFSVLLGAFTPCAVTVAPSPVYINSVGGTQTFTVTPTGASCTYPVSTDQGGFVHLAAGAGYSAGMITVTIDPNMTGADRSANLFIGSTTVPITEYFTTAHFGDLPPGSFAFDAINLMEQYGIATGCGSGNYCPTENVSRAQMAVFIITGIYGGPNFTLMSQTPYFADVPQGSFGFTYVQKMYELGITSGCGGGNYCPGDSVTRADMAKFIIIARYGAGTAYTIPSTVYFPVDVPPSYAFFPEIERMAEDGITSGCGTNQFCPADLVSRAQMAVFIIRGELNQLLAPTAPIITSISPNTLAVGTSGTFTIMGLNTSFSGSTVIVPAGGVTATNIVVLSPTQMTAILTSAPGSPANPVSIYEQTEPQEAVLPNGLELQ